MEYSFDEKNNMTGFLIKDLSGKTTYQVTYSYKFDTKGRKIQRDEIDINNNMRTYLVYNY
jgi:hypothetical protein